jgi:hypothetical protein
MQLRVHLRIGQGEEGFQCSGFPAACAFQGILDAPGHDQLQHVRLLQRPLDSSRRDHGAEVDQRPGHGRDRDPAQDGGVALVEVADAVEVDVGLLRASAPRAHGHFDGRTVRAQDAPMVRRGPVTQHSAAPARIDSTE